MSVRMNERKAIEILKKTREYYNMHRQDYDKVIKWLEGRLKRSRKKGATKK